MTDLAKKRCESCEGNASALQGPRLEELRMELGGGWKLGPHLEKEFEFKDFREALDFTNMAGEIAEQEQHHPDIYLTWGKVHLTIWTHKVGGLTESDFILAAKIDAAMGRS